MIVTIAVLTTAGWLWCWLQLRLRAERIARATHDLRAPLCAARLAAHAAGREHGWPAVAPIDLELGRAALMLDDLDAARTGRRVAVPREDIDARELLDEVARTWAPLAWPVGRDVRVERPDGPRVVFGERRRLAQALGNLVGNALEHGCGAVVLSACADRGRVRLVVADDGPGPAEPLGALTRRARGGRGARGRGLAIAQSVARGHGGALRAERTTSGSRLVLELPAADAPPALSTVPVPAPEPWPALVRELRWGGVVRPGRARR